MNKNQKSSIVYPCVFFLLILWNASTSAQSFTLTQVMRAPFPSDLVFVSIQSASTQQSENYAEEIKIFEAFLQKQMAVDRIPGLSIGFMKDDFIWAKGFGYADMENKTPATEKSAYRLASNTKSMTAVAVLQLVEKGRIDLDAEVQTYVPHFPRKRWPVTVRQLLGHLGGISHYQNYDIEGHIKEYKDTRDALAIFADFDLVAEPGTKYHYSSYGYNLLGAVIEGAARQSYGDYLRENLWEPLGMHDTYMDDPDEILPGRVRGYRLVDGEIQNSEYVDISSRFAAGGTRSTVVDLLKYAKGLRTKKVLSRESVDLMYTSMITKDDHSIDYGMGWRVTPVNGRFHVYHTGGQPETRTLLVRFPNENFAIALAYNLEGANLHVYSHRLAQLILGEPWNMPVCTGNKVDDALYDGLWDVFNYGLCHFKRHQEPMTADPKGLAEAFKYFRDTVNRDSLQSDFKKTVRRVRDGRHPVAKEAFVKIGSYMAMRLQEKYGARAMGVYHKMGAIRFFHDYVKAYQTIPDHPAEFRFSNAIERIVTQWDEDWERTNTAYIRRLTMAPFSDVDPIGKELKKIFSGAEIYPDFSGDFARVVRYFSIQEDSKRALRIAQLALDCYPNLPTALASLANVHACFGQREEALKLYRKAMEINPDDRALGAGRLNEYATGLIDWGRLDVAMELLKLAVELYPQEAELYNSIAEIYLKRGKKYYRKALEVDPTFEPARERLKMIQ